MAEKEFMDWLMTIVLPIALSVASFYAVAKSSTSNLEHRLTELETISKSQEKIIDMHASRLDKHDEEQKTMQAMIEQVKNLSVNVGELKTDLKEIKERL